jgi:hypothetical protein
MVLSWDQGNISVAPLLVKLASWAISSFIILHPVDLRLYPSIYSG